MVARRLRVIAAFVVIAVVFVTPVLDTATATPASADTVVNGCTIVSNPTSTNFTNCPGASLESVDLSGVDLSFANLAGADFSFSTLNGANLSNANLSSTLLADTNLSNAILSSANLTSAVLAYCFDNTAAQGVLCFTSNLTDANLTGANLTDAPAAVCLNTSSDGADCGAADLSGAVLSGANLTGATFGACVSPAGAALPVCAETLLVPSNQTVLATSGAGAVVTWPTPSLPGATLGTCSPSSGSTFAIGVTIVTCQVHDDHGGVATGTFLVQVTATTITTSTGLSAGNSLVGQQVVYEANVTPIPTGGTVGFSDNGSPITGCSAVSLLITSTGDLATCFTTYSTAGAHNIVATYSGSGAILGSTSPTVTVTVFPPPSTSVLLPSNDATVTGNTVLDASAQSGAGILSVSFEVSGNGLTNHVVATGTPTLYGYLAKWNTTSVPNGTYSLQSVATDGDLNKPTSAPITITVNNQPPATAVLIPSGGATVSGAKALLDASASSAAGIASVTYEVSGNGLTNHVVATGTPTLYGYLAQWNTTAVPNGTYTLQSVATDTVAESTTSAPVSVTVDNAPPTTTVVLPSNNASVTGNQYLDATASSGVTQVTYEVSGGPANLSDVVVATGTPTLYGWLAAWNTTGLANGTYTLQSVASYGGGVSGTSAPVTITVAN
jgi:hypothetical protein